MLTVAVEVQQKMSTSRALHAKAAAPLLVAAALMLTACPTTRWLERSASWEVEGREHNAPSVLVWAEEPDPDRSWPGGIVGLYMIEGYLRHWPATAPPPYQPLGRYLAVMTLHHHDTDADEMMSVAVRECRKFDPASQVPTPFLLTRGGDLGSHIYLCATAELAAALEQPAERERAEGYLYDAGFHFSPTERRAGSEAAS